VLDRNCCRFHVNCGWRHFGHGNRLVRAVSPATPARTWEHVYGAESKQMDHISQPLLFFLFSCLPFDRSHNITRQLDKYFPSLVTPDNLLMAARVSTIPFTVAATIVAVQVRETGYLLIVALYVHTHARMTRILRAC
jgi:hypothetical protein